MQQPPPIFSPFSFLLFGFFVGVFFATLLFLLKAGAGLILTNQSRSSRVEKDFLDNRSLLPTPTRQKNLW